MVAFAQTRERDSRDRQVVGLAPAGGEYDAVGLAAEQCGDLRPRALDRRARYGAVPVGARRVAERTLQIRTHRVEDLRRDRCRGVVIEVDPLRPN